MQRKRIFSSVAVFPTTLACVILGWPQSGLTQSDESQARRDSVYNMFEEAFEHLHHERFRKSIELGTQLRERYPEEPSGAFALLIAYQTINRNYRVRLFDAKVDSLMDLSIDLAEDAVAREKKDAMNYFYLGCAYGLRCLCNMNRREWMAAIRDGSRVYESFEKALAYDPEFYDSYFGLGMHKYWLGAKSKLVRVFTGGAREEGLKYLKLVAEKGRFLKTDAMFNLSAAYYNEGEYHEALAWTDKLHGTYLNNPTLWYRRGRILQSLNEWQTARSAFERLHEILVTSEYQSLSYQIECLYQMARCEFELDSFVESRELCQQAMALEKDCDFSKEYDGPYEKFSEIREQLHDLHDELETIALTKIGTTGSQ